MGLFSKKTEIPFPERAPPGRSESMPVADRHFVLDAPMLPPYPDGLELALFGMGCFWGVERVLWQVQGVFTTAVGYAGGTTPNPVYEEVCSGLTGHNEVAQVVFNPSQVSYPDLLRLFWEGHDPTQGMRQGNDVGTQYRSGIYYHSATQAAEAESSRDAYRERLREAGYGDVTTEIVEAEAFYFAEDYHQQYLAKNPMGYCGVGGTGVSCPIGLAVWPEPITG